MCVMAIQLKWHLKGYALHLNLIDYITLDDVLQASQRLSGFFEQAVHEQLHMLVDCTQLDDMDKLPSQKLAPIPQHYKLGWMVAYGISDIQHALLGEKMAEQFGFRFHSSRIRDDAVEFLNLYAFSVHPELYTQD